MNRRLLIIAIVLLLIALGFIVLRSRKAPPYDYLSNVQYQEQTNIFGAYQTKCEIAFIGDSHIYKCHWSELLGVVCCNRGIGSDITEGVYSRVKEVVVARPAICFIASGSNDIDLRIPEDTTIEYFRKIVQDLKSAGICPVIMEITSVGEGYPNAAFNDKAESLNTRLRSVCETIRISVDQRDLQPDGIHLTASGYFKWGNAIAGVLHP